MILYPVLVSAAILGGMYAFGRDTGRPADQEKPHVDVLPQDQIPQDLQRRMQTFFDQLAQLGQGGRPPPFTMAPGNYGNPVAWEQLAALLNQAIPGNPQSPEALAIANALRALGATGPGNLGPMPPIPSLPSGPVPIPPALQTQLNQVLSGLPPPFNTAIPSFPFPGPPTTGPLAPSIDPNALTLLASQVEAALGAGRPEPAQLRAIAAQLVPVRTPMAVMQGAPVALARYAPRYARFLEAQQARVGAPYYRRRRHRYGGFYA